MRKRVCIAALGASVAFLAAGCGGSGGSSGTTTSGVGGATKTKLSGTLEILGFGTNGDDVAQTRFAIAKKAVSPVKVQAPNGGFEDQQFLSQLASGNPPDLIYTDRYRIGELAAKGALEPLTSCIANEGIDTSQYRKPAMQQVTYRGTVYGIPEFYDNRTIIVNDAAVSQAGLSPSDVSTSDWSKLKTVARKLTTMSGGKPTRIGFDPKIPEFFPLWAKANGADLLSADGLHARLDSPKAVQALEFTVSLIDEQGGWNKFSSFRNTWDFFGAGNQVVKNQVGAWPMEDWYYNVLASVSPKVHVTAVPFTNRQGQPIDWETGSAWAIPKGAKNPQAACVWAKTMTEVSTWVAAAKHRKQLYAQKHQFWTGLFTANAKADAKINTPTPGEPKEWADAMKTVLKVQDSAFGIPASPASEEFDTAWTDAVNRVLQGQQSPKQSLAQAQQQAQKAIDAANH